MRRTWQACGFLSLVIWTFLKFNAAQGAAGKIDLYLQNNQLDPKLDRAQNNIAYYGVYYIGTPPRRFLGCFDTGSGDTWVPSNTCTSTVCRSHDQYDPSASSTEQNTSRSPVTIRYGTGTVNVRLTYDTFSMAGINITNQGFGVAEALTFDFSTTSCDGLVGLGFQPLSSLNAPPPFINAVRENALDNNLFSLWLSPDPGQEPAGELSFGSVDNSRYTGSIQYVNVTKTSYWQVPMDGIIVGGENIGVPAQTAIVDSGTTAIVMSTSDAKAINNKISGSSYWQSQNSWNVSCDINRLPNITFVLGGKQFSVPPRLYVQLLTDMDGNSLGVCSSSIVGGGSNVNSAPNAVLGTNFLRTWYTVYSVDSQSGKSQVGFASSAGQAARSSGGRKLMDIADNQPLFSRPIHTLRHPRVGHISEEQRLHHMEGSMSH